jgi:hypothetical protein
MDVVYAIGTFLVTNWVPIIAVAALLELWEISRLLRLTIKSLGILGEELIRHHKQVEREEGAADEMSP